jgi:nicotinate-nucleotide--dimethylbenzimidazole phosphoribosyltransferase
MTGPLAGDCARYAEDWSALLDGELEPPREAQMRAHAETCASCAAKLASLARVDVLLAGLPVPETRAALFAGLRARIEAQAADDAAPARPSAVRRAPPSARRWRARGWLAAAVAAAAALALYFALPRPAPLTPATEPRVARAPEPPPSPVPAPAPAPVVVPAADPEFDALPAEEIAVGLDLDTAQDLDVIANLELLEAYVALEEGRG